MRDSPDHNWDVAYMMPQKTLISLHEEEHSAAEPGWHGSADAYRSL